METFSSWVFEFSVGIIIMHGVFSQVRVVGAIPIPKLISFLFVWFWFFGLKVKIGLGVSV